MQHSTSIKGKPGGFRFQSEWFFWFAAAAGLGLNLAGVKSSFLPDGGELMWFVAFCLTAARAEQLRKSKEISPVAQRLALVPLALVVLSLLVLSSLIVYMKYFYVSPIK